MILRDDSFTRKFLEFPRDLPEEDKLKIFERARYETFTQPGMVSKATFFSVATTLAALLVVIAVNVALVMYTPLKEAGVFYQSLVGAFVLGVMFILLHVIQHRFRAKMIAPRVKEMLES